MKRFSTFILLCSLLLPLSAQKNEKEQKLEQTIQKFIKYYNDKDSVNFNQLIDEELGVYILCTFGSTPIHRHYKNISFDKEYAYSSMHLPTPVPEMLMEQKLRERQKVQYKSSLELWGESRIEDGLYVDDVSEKHFLSDVIKVARKYNDIDITDKKLKKIVEQENNSLRVAIISSGGGIWGDSLFIYLTYKEGDWYLYTIDYFSLEGFN